MFQTNDPSRKEFRRKLRNEMPKSEKMLWYYLRNRNFLKMRWRRQFGIGPYIADFYCPEYKVVIEIDGDSHFETEESIKKDNIRSSYVESLGNQIVHYTNLDIQNNIEGVLESLREQCLKLGVSSEDTPPNLP